MLTIYCSDPNLQTQAEQTALRLQQPLQADNPKAGYVLAFAGGEVALHTYDQKKQNPIKVDLHMGAAEHRRKYGGGKSQMIAKAAGVSAGFKPRVLDATAGLGGDAFVLASLGCTLNLQERSPVAHALLANGLERALNHIDAHKSAHQQNDLDTNLQDFADVIGRMTLSYCDSHNMQAENIDVIYLDPMFPERKKKAAVNKSMKAFHDLIGGDDDADSLLEQALQQPVKRIVVKRPRIAPVLANTPPTYTLEGKSSRFDIYALQKLGS